MTEIRWTKFTHGLIANRLYESTNSNSMDVINDVEQRDRVMTRKDMKWSWDGVNGYVYTNDAVKATLNDTETDYVIKIQGTASDAGSFYSHSMLREYGVCDVSWIGADELCVGRTLICSRSSGLWIAGISDDITIAHVAGSPCCTSISFDKYQTDVNGYYVLTANNECFDSYDIDVDGDVLTITSIKELNNGSSTFEYTKIVTINDDIITVDIKYDGVNVVRVDERVYDDSNNKLISTGYKIVTYRYQSSPVLYVYIGHGDAKDVNAMTMPTIGISTSLMNTALNLYASNATGWGMIYYAGYVSDGGMPTNWMNMSTRLGSFTRCPSVINCAVGTNTSISTNAVYYFGTDDFNDYIGGHDIIDDTENVLFAGDVGSLTQGTLTTRCVYDTHGTGLVVNDDVWVIRSNLGVLSLCGWTNDDYTYKTWSGDHLNVTVRGVTYSVTNFASLVVGGNRYEFAFDDVCDAVVGVYELQPNWVRTWENNYHRCDMRDLNALALDVSDYPCIAKIISNDDVIYAATVGNDIGEEGIYYCSPTVYGSNVFDMIYSYPAGKKFVDLIRYGNDLVLILEDRAVIFWKFGSATGSNIETLKTQVVSLTNVLMYSDVDAPHAMLSNKVIQAAKVGTGIGVVVCVDDWGGIGVVDPGVMAGANTITVNGTITGPTITDIYDKLATIRSALGLS